MSTKVGAKTKGWIKDNVTGEIMNFQFNPTNLQYPRSTNYANVTSPGMAYPGTQFVSGEIREFSVELYIYDRPSTGKMKETSEFLGKLLMPETNVANMRKKPDDFTLCIGYFVRQCVLKSLDINVTLFDENLQPVEAYYTLEIRQVGE